jgi:hypothetical protein
MNVSYSSFYYLKLLNLERYLSIGLGGHLHVELIIRESLLTKFSLQFLNKMV